jgi:hypothetical protein
MRFVEPCAAYSLYILATLLQVADSVMAACEILSDMDKDEDEMDKICGALRSPAPLAACI